MRSRRCSRRAAATTRRRHQAGAPRVRARDRHQAVPRRRARPARSCAGCAARSPRSPSRRDLTIGSAGTHPFALWEDQRISARPRYRDLIEMLRFVARQEVIFGLHVHVGIDDADKAIHVANGMRVHAAAAARAVGQLAVLARRRHGAGLRPDADLPPVPARRDAARLQGLGRLRAPHRLHDRLEGDGGLHLPLVRRPPAPELRDGRDPRRWTRRPGSSTRSGSRR